MSTISIVHEIAQKRSRLIIDVGSGVRTLTFDASTCEITFDFGLSPLTVTLDRHQDLLFQLARWLGSELPSTFKLPHCENPRVFKRELESVIIPSPKASFKLVVRGQVFEGEYESGNVILRAPGVAVLSFQEMKLLHDIQNDFHRIAHGVYRF